MVLIDGAHRLEAMRLLGRDTIPVSAFSCTDVDAAMMEAGQNLPGGMASLDDAVFLAAFKAAYLKKHPETARGVAGAAARHGVQLTKLSFVKLIAARRGVTERHISRTIAVAESLTRDEIDQLRRSPSRVTMQDLLALGKIADPDERAAVVARMVEDDGTTAAKARKALRATTATPAVEDPVEAAMKALKTAWSRAPKEARRRFARDHADELAALIYEGVPE